MITAFIKFYRKKHGYCSEKSALWSLKDYDSTLLLVKEINPDDYVDYLYLFSSLSMYSPMFRNLLKDVIVKYRDTSQSIIFNKQVERQRQFDKGSLNFYWDDIMDVHKKMAEKEYGSMKHLMLALYVMIPPLRDDFGCVMLSKKYPIFLKNGNKYNCYNLETRTLHLHHYKNSSSKGEVKIKFPKDLHDLILHTIKKIPRVSLLADKDNVPYQGGISPIFKDTYGFTITEIRRAFTTSVIDHETMSVKDKIRLL